MNINIDTHMLCIYIYVDNCNQFYICSIQQTAYDFCACAYDRLYPIRPRNHGGGRKSNHSPLGPCHGAVEDESGMRHDGIGLCLFHVALENDPIIDDL